MSEQQILSPARIDSFSGEYRFLSNFWPREKTDTQSLKIVWDGIEFPSVEHAYQAAKTDDLNERYRISLLKLARDAKRAGKKIKLKASWNLIRVEIMRVLVHIKFQEPSLRDLLLATGDAELVEGNWWHDYFWGICGGKGQNTLGKILMAERESIRRGDADVIASG